MSDKVPLVRVLTSSTGTSTVTLGVAYSQLFMTMAEAGAVDGRTYTYLIVDGNNWEIGKGVYTASGTTLSRVSVLASRISGTLGTSRITLSGTAQVRIVESAVDMDGVRGTRSVTGTSDILASTDLGYVVTYSNAAAVAVSLAQAGTASLYDGWATHVQNLGVGTATITAATSTINGASTLVLPTNMGAFLWSDGTNYHAYFIPVSKPLLAASNLADVASASTALSNLGGAAKSANLSDLASASAAKGNIGALPLIVVKTANYTVLSTDLGKLISCSIAQASTLTLGSPSAATVGNGWSFFVENTGYGAVVFTPSSGTIDGKTSINVFKGQSFEIVTDGTTWKSKGRQTSFTIASLTGVSASAGASLLLPDGLSMMELQISGAWPATSATALALQVSTNGGSSFISTTSYVTNILYANSANAAAAQSNTTATYIGLTGAMINSNGGYNAVGSVKVNRQVAGSNSGFAVSGTVAHYNPGGTPYYQINDIGGYYNAGSFVQAVMLMAVSGNVNADAVILTGFAP
jgi:hypothetical protein